MRTHARMLAMAEENMEDAANVYAKIEALHPERLPMARLMLDDTIRVYNIVEASQRLSRSASLEVISLLKRADLLTQALRRPLQ